MYECQCQTIYGIQHEKAYSPIEYSYVHNTSYETKNYYDFVTFDIETSRYHLIDDIYESFMYHWQICVNGDVIFGRTWAQLVDFFKSLLYNTEKKIVVYVHNLAYEFQFMKTFFEWDNIFAISEHTILRATTKDGLEFRCSYKLSNMNLEKFIENTPEHYYIKAKGDLDYSILRTPSTELNQLERGYCYNDVAGLYHSIQNLLKEDDLKSIPMTSTGYVRRECREACRKERKDYFNKSKLDYQIYLKLKKAFRGGNTASSRFHANSIIDNVHSYDISSSYPYVLMVEDFPHGKFMKASIISRDELDYYNKKYCTIGSYQFFNLRLKKQTTPIPYISKSKCDKCDNDSIIYNGRVIESNYIQTELTNVDFEIIDNMYDYDELYVDDFYFAKKKKLPKGIRKTVMKYFEDKTKLKGIDEEFYFYMKQKGKLNAIYGMMVSNIVRDTFEYDIEKNMISSVEKNEEKKEKELEKYYKSRNSFLCYQWGVWVTAYARKRLQQLIDIIGIDVVYCDTDSVKYIGDYDEEIEKINKSVMGINAEIPFYVKHNDDNVYMGVWDSEKPYDEFITMGAKKYAYVQNEKIGVTVSGLSKKNAPIELAEKGGLKAFKKGTVFVNSGRVTVEYMHKANHILKIDDEEILTGSYINMFDTTYTLGITDTMLNIIENPYLI